MLEPKIQHRFCEEPASDVRAFLEFPLALTSEELAGIAVDALMAEANLTPKPALVDGRGPGAHKDLTLELLFRSAQSLQPWFCEMAAVSQEAYPCQNLREVLAAIGRRGEEAMYAATGGCNAHKGAIWALGLLIAGAAISQVRNARAITHTASLIARFPDSKQIPQITNGVSAAAKFGVRGARGEACEGFPHVLRIGLPMLQEARRQGLPEHVARLDTLLAIMAELDDTCLLHRAGMTGLITAKRGARMVLAAGGTSTARGREAFQHLDTALLEQNASPGGSADLLAATLFLDSLIEPEAVFFDSTEEESQRWKK